MVTEPTRPTTGHISCPIFAGVAGDVRSMGWTIQGPAHQFYTTDPANVSSENGIYSVFNYELAKAASEASSARAAFLIYTKLGSTAASMTTGQNIHALDVLCEVNADYAVTTNLRNADVRAARIQVYGHNNVSGVCHGAYINCQLNGTYTFNGRYLESTSSYGGIGLEVRTETSGSGTVTCNDALVNLFLIYKGSRPLTGDLFMIAINKPYEGNAVSGETVAIKFVNGNVLVGETDFDIGIDFASDTIKAINIDECSLVLDADVAFSGGTSGNIHSILVADSSTATEVNAYYTQMDTTGDISGAKYRMAGNFRIRVGGSAGDGAATFAGLWTSIGITAAAAPTLGTLCGLYVYMNALGSATVGSYHALDLHVNATNAATQDGYIKCYCHGGSPMSILWLANSGVPTATYLIDFEATLAPFSTGDVNPTGTTGDNALGADGKIRIRVGATSYYIPCFTTTV